MVCQCPIIKIITVNMSPKINPALNTSEQSSKNKQAKAKSKKSYDETLDSLRKSKVRGDNSIQNNKILRYLNTSVTIKHNNQQNQPLLEKSYDSIQKLEEKIKEKDKIIRDLKDKKEQEEQRSSNASFQYRIFNQKTKIIQAKVQLQLAQARRREKSNRNSKIGAYNESSCSFEESSYVIEIRQILYEKQNAIKALEETKKVKKNSEESARMLSSFEFLTKEVNIIKKQLEYLEKQLIVQKERARLVAKQRRSHYCRLDWPLVYQNYQVLELLGAGGFGEVYKCYDLENRCYTAIKRVQFPKDESQNTFQYILREVEIIQKLDHPNIAKFKKILEIVPEKCVIVFEMEYCEGPELSTYLKKSGCIEQKLAKQIVKQLFSALSYMSSLREKIIHYDIKPGNIMFHNGAVKLLDFGLSKMISRDETRTQLTTIGIGTYWYLPPEAFNVEFPQVSNKIDVWSLGVVFYQLLYGSKPFGNGLTQDTVLKDGIILKATVVEFPGDNPRHYRVSDQAKEFIRQCLQYNEMERLSPSQGNEHEYLNK